MTSPAFSSSSLPSGVVYTLYYRVKLSRNQHPLTDTRLPQCRGIIHCHGLFSMAKILLARVHSVQWDWAEP